MFEKDSILIEDILESASKIEAYIDGVTFDTFANDDMRTIQSMCLLFGKP
jgi:uncharacterized protein with HEPN domain